MRKTRSLPSWRSHNGSEYQIINIQANKLISGMVSVRKEIEYSNSFNSWHLLKSSFVPTTLWSRYYYSLSILLMWKLRHREMRWLPKVKQLVGVRTECKLKKSLASEPGSCTPNSLGQWRLRGRCMLSINQGRSFWGSSIEAEMSQKNHEKSWQKNVLAEMGALCQ